MNKVIIINGPSCAGKTTIAKKIRKQSNNQFAHLQIDKTVEFCGTIFPKEYQFAKNIINKENNYNIPVGSFDDNRLARRKLIASILLATAKELLHQGFSVVIDTALDGPDAQELAKLYLKYLSDYHPKFVGVYCPLEERLKRLKTRTDNLFLTEDFIRNQTDQYDVFEICKKLYHVWFDSSRLNSSEIASKLLN